MTAIASIRAAAHLCVESTRVFLRDVGAGLLVLSHNVLALLGLVVLGAALFAGGRDEVRSLVERHALDWLQARHEARSPVVVDTPLLPEPEPDAVARATAADPKALPRQQAAIAQWLARRYKVAPEPLSRLVQEAWTVGHRMGLDPTLILAIMAIESSFNPFAQSPVGAQGLMQVLTRVHDDKYQAYGGVRAAFDPVSNLRVGVQVLKECIARAGSLEDGLRHYVGAALHGNDGGYVGKVLGEQDLLRQVADGRQVPLNAVLIRAVPPMAPPASAPDALGADAPATRAAPPMIEADAVGGPETAPTPAPRPSQPASQDERVALVR